MPAQNLIPNPGFEEGIVADGYQWVQPQGPYYHYEHCPSAKPDCAHRGEHVNGICMYSHEPNEYLHVRLLEPLKPGERYAFSVFVRLMPHKATNAKAQKSIGVYFGGERLDTHLPGDLWFKPQLHLKLPGWERFSWFLLRDTLTAEGGEEFLTIGYFPEFQRRDIREHSAAAFMSEIEREYAAKQRSGEDTYDKSWLYLPPEEQKKYLKARKKKEKKWRKARSKTPDCPAPVTASKARSQKTMSEIRMPEPTNEEPFVVRYYFDDFCLAMLDENGEARCAPKETASSKTALKSGATIALPNVFFDLDEATLLTESMVQLNALKATLEAHPTLEIEIRGHTDNQGPAAYNLELSDRRAEAVVQWLIGQGVDARRLSSQGFGAAHPIATNATDAGRSRNRRVEFYIVKGI